MLILPKLLAHVTIVQGTTAKGRIQSMKVNAQGQHSSYSLAVTSAMHTNMLEVCVSSKYVAICVFINFSKNINLYSFSSLFLLINFFFQKLFRIIILSLYYTIFILYHLYIIYHTYLFCKQNRQVNFVSFFQNSTVLIYRLDNRRAK